MESIGELGSQAWLAFAAGLLSVLSPCVLPLLPAYLSLVSGLSVEEMAEAGAEGRGRGPLLRACLGFIAGFSTIFIVLGVGAVAAGRALRTWRAELFGLEFGAAQVAGVMIIVLGLHMAGLTPIRLLYRDTRPAFRGAGRGFASSYLVGSGFALGWSPCVGPILAAILTVAASRETLGQGVLLLAIYSAGLAVPFLAAGLSLDYFFRAFGRIKRHLRKLELASGMVLVGVGFLLLTDRFTMFNSRFRFMSDWITAAERALQ